MDWDDLRFLLAIGRASTLAGAARRLGVNQTTVARRLASAEKQLGSKLFTRVEGNLHPTPAGEAALQHARAVEEEIAALKADAGRTDDAPSGNVRISAVPLLVNHLLAPAAPDLLKTYPKLRLDFLADGRNADLRKGEADVALRLGRPEKGGAHLMQRLGLVTYAAYGPAERSDDSPWLVYDESLSHLPHAQWLAAAAEVANAQMAFNDGDAILQAIEAGAGRSLVPCFIGDRRPRLRRLPGPPGLARELWLLTHASLRHQQRIVILRDWIATLVRQKLNGA